MAGNRKRRHRTDWDYQFDYPGQHPSLLLGARHRRTGLIHSPEKNLTFYVKGDHEYTAYSHFVGTTIVFGGMWTLRIPKPAPPPNLEAGIIPHIAGWRSYETRFLAKSCQKRESTRVCFDRRSRPLPP